MPDTTVTQILCSFCGKSRQEVGHMVQGARAYICDSCVGKASKVIDSRKGADAQSETTEILPPSKIREHLDRYVIGQERAKKVLAVAVYNHYIRLFDASKDLRDDTEIEKANILMMGPTGCGKTLLAKSVARYLHVPFAIADATTLTEAGFVGDDVEDIIARLLMAAGGDVKRAEKGIVFIDEIDKIGRHATSSNMVRDIRGEGVQQALLKLIEGSKIMVPQHGHRRTGNADRVEVDTTHILYIVSGAFVGLDEVIGKRVNKNAMSKIGYGAQEGREAAVKGESDLLSRVKTEDLREYGMIPEFLGRLPVTVTLRELTEDEMVQVLTEPRNAYVRQYQKLFEYSGVRLTFEEAALRLIAQKALQEKKGARGLRSIVEGVLANLMYDIPSQKGRWQEAVITAHTVEGGDPILVETQAQATG